MLIFGGHSETNDLYKIIFGATVFFLLSYYENYSLVRKAELCICENEEPEKKTFQI